MRRRNAHVVALLISFSLATAVRGQESPTTKTLITKQKWIRFVMVQGRILAIVPRGQNGAMSSSEDASIRETLGVHGQGDSTLVRYQRQCAKQEIQIHFFGQSDLELERRPLAPEIQPLRLKQPARGPVILDVGPADAVRRYEAPTLWHLFVTQPEVCRHELIPVLQILRPDWRLKERSHQIESLLLTEPSGDAPLGWEQLVAQLGDARFPVRQAAERELRSGGQNVLPFLENLDTSRLNAEQRSRVRAIRDSLGDQSEDTASRVAAWMVNDVRLWQAWSEHGAVAQRSQASLQLARLARTPESAPRVADRALVRTSPTVKE